MDTANTKLIYVAQREAFSEDLAGNKSIPKHSKLSKLDPFIDDDGIVRIRGRLKKYSDLSYDSKHPVILPKDHLSKLLVQYQHIVLEHAGVNKI